MNNGSVKFFNDTKGFGFIKDAASNKEYFVHVSGLVDKIKEKFPQVYDVLTHIEPHEDSDPIS